MSLFVFVVQEWVKNWKKREVLFTFLSTILVVVNLASASWVSVLWNWLKQRKAEVLFTFLSTILLVVNLVSGSWVSVLTSMELIKTKKSRSIVHIPFYKYNSSSSSSSELDLCFLSHWSMELIKTKKSRSVVHIPFYKYNSSGSELGFWFLRSAFYSHD